MAQKAEAHQQQPTSNATTADTTPQNGNASPTATPAERERRGSAQSRGSRTSIRRESMTQYEGLYERLGLEKTCTEDEIKRAYRRLALRYHPDKNPDDAEAAEKFVEINRANMILSNPMKRQFYDTYGPMGIKMMETIGEDNIAPYLMMKNPWFKCIFFTCCLLTGCYFCCCCCCCCNCCCGKCVPKDRHHWEPDDFVWPDAADGGEGGGSGSAAGEDRVPIVVTEQPQASDSPRQPQQQQQQPERPAVIAMPPPPPSTTTTTTTTSYQNNSASPIAMPPPAASASPSPNSNPSSPHEQTPLATELKSTPSSSLENSGATPPPTYGSTV